MGHPSERLTLSRAHRPRTPDASCGREKPLEGTPSADGETEVRGDRIRQGRPQPGRTLRPPPGRGVQRSLEAASGQRSVPGRPLEEGGEARVCAHACANV